jgi:GNAT superfamily N-acetyltransferase
MDWHLSLENHWLACMAQLGRGARVSRVPGALVVANPTVTGHAFNFIALRGADPARLGATLELGSALLAGEGRGPALFLSPAAGDVATLGAALQAAGWGPRLEQVVLICTLPRPEPPTGAPAEPSGLTIQRIGPESRETWGATLVQGYEVEPLAGEAIASAWAALLTNPGEAAKAHLYLATVGGQAAGTGLTWIRSDIAGLYCGAVVPAFRRQGVERATVQRRMADATAAGARAAFLQTAPESPVEHLCVNRLGFQVAYTRSLWLPR